MSRQKVLVGVSSKFLKEFDTVAEKLNKTRSELIRESMRFFVTYHDEVELVLERLDQMGEQPFRKADRLTSES